jgi:mevalonate pyrophosphate decarboxylase
MKIDIYSSPMLLVEHARDIETIFCKAVHEALTMHKRAGNTIAVWRDGQIQLIKAEDIVVD